MGGWIAFWDSEHPIYVNARHREVHYAAIVADIAPYVPGPDAVVIDYGCGEALHADRIAAVAARLILCEAAPTVRAGLARRFAGDPRVSVAAPEDVAALPDGSVDLIVMVSVAQYLTRDELDALLALFRRLLKPQGRFILADVIPPHVSPVTDALALLRFAARHGFLGAAVLGLVRTAVSDYRRLRNALGLTLYDEAEMTGKLATAGFAPRRAGKNVGHNPARMTFVSQPG